MFMIHLMYLFRIIMCICMCVLFRCIFEAISSDLNDNIWVSMLFYQNYYFIARSDVRAHRFYYLIHWLSFAWSAYLSRKYNFGLKSSVNLIFNSTWEIQRIWLSSFSLSAENIHHLTWKCGYNCKFQKKIKIRKKRKE